MQSSLTKVRPACVFVFDSTRLRSHLFFRYLSTSPELHPIYHPFLLSLMFGPDAIAQHLRHSEMRTKELEVDLRPCYGPDTVESDRTKLEHALARAKELGKIPLVNEHWFNVVRTDLVLSWLRSQPFDLEHNPTYLPDDLFATLSPIILIRHPALSVGSIYRSAIQITKQRPGDEDFTMICSNEFLRRLFDLFRDQGRQPFVVDAEDILWKTDDLASNLGAHLGIDANTLSASWEPTPSEVTEAMNPLVLMLTKTIHESRGIERPSVPPPAPSIEAEAKVWVEEYGEDVARSLQKLAEANMPHYEYLKQFKVLTLDMPLG